MTLREMRSCTKSINNSSYRYELSGKFGIKLNYLLQKEELEWYGLDLNEACAKQAAIEEAELRNYVPLKHKLRMELIEELKNASLEPEKDKEDL